MQAKSDSFSEFSERTESLSTHLHAKLSDLPAVIGISPAMFHAYRSGKYPISLKAWRKLEQAERSAGILPPDTAPGDGPTAVAESQPDEYGSMEIMRDSLQEQIDDLRRQISSQQLPISYTMAELQFRMQQSGAWPPSPEDSQCHPDHLWQKYAPVKAVTE